MSGNPIRLLIADDHPVVLHGLRDLFHAAGHCVVATAADGGEAVRSYREHKPDVAMLDVRMPVKSGIEALREIRSGDPAARIVMLTTFDDEEDVCRAIEEGARGYVLKESSAPELMNAVLRVFAEQRYLSPEVSARLAERMDHNALTPREVEVLRLAARGLKNKEIATSLEIGTGTVKGHLEAILVKLGAADRTAAVTIALQRGILALDRL
jgi:DNA-binding NarL/FixJ family response regulator